MTDHISHSSQITGKIIFPCILIVICLGVKRKGKRLIQKATSSALMSLYDVYLQFVINPANVSGLMQNARCIAASEVAGHVD